MAAASGKRTRREWGAVRQLPSGRHQASYQAPDGRRYTAPITFDTVTDARAYLAGVRTRISAGTWRSPSEEAAERELAEAEKARKAQTFGSFAAKWIEDRHSVHGEPLRPKTRAEYERLLNGPLSSLSPLPLAAISKGTIVDWHTAQLRTKKKTQTARSYSVLRTILESAVDRGVISENPATIPGAGSTSTGREVLPPTADELAVIVATIPDRFKAAVLLAAWSGLRYGELTELRRKDLKVTRKNGAVVSIVVTVKRAVVHTPSGPVVGPPKTKSGVRTLALPPNAPGLFEALSRHLARNVQASPDALLFPAASDPTVHLRQSSLAKAWYPAREAAGRTDLSWHGLRHYAASVYSAAGATPTEVAARLGQSSAGIANRYTHVFDARVADLVNRTGTS